MFIGHLVQMGIYAYRSATQLNLVEGDVIPKQTSRAAPPLQVSPSQLTTPAHSSSQQNPHQNMESQTLNQSQSNIDLDKSDLKSRGDNRNVPRASCTRATSSSDEHDLTLFPHEAKHLIDHVVYLPVHRNVPFEQLDYLVDCVAVALQKCHGADPTNPTTNNLEMPKPKLKCKM